MDATKDQEKLSTELDKQLLARVKSGEATASELNVARQRLRDLGLTQVIKPGDAIDELTKILAKEGKDIMILPALDEGEDAATVRMKAE